MCALQLHDLAHSRCASTGNDCWNEENVVVGVIGAESKWLEGIFFGFQPLTANNPHRPIITFCQCTNKASRRLVHHKHKREQKMQIHVEGKKCERTNAETDGRWHGPGPFACGIISVMWCRTAQLTRVTKTKWKKWKVLVDTTRHKPNLQRRKSFFFLFHLFGWKQLPSVSQPHRTEFGAIFNGEIKCSRRPYSHRGNKKNMMFECKSRAGPNSMGRAHGSYERVGTQQRCVRVVGECIKFALTFSVFLCIQNAFNVSTADVVDWSCSRQREMEKMEKKEQIKGDFGGATEPIIIYAEYVFSVQCSRITSKQNFCNWIVRRFFCCEKVCRQCKWHTAMLFSVLLVEAPALISLISKDLSATRNTLAQIRNALKRERERETQKR